MATRRFFDGAQIEIGSLPIEGAAVQTIILNRLESTAQTFNPTVIRQTSSVITLDRLESTAQIFLPVVTQGGGVQTITLNRLESTAQIFLPTEFKQVAFKQLRLTCWPLRRRYSCLRLH